MQYLSINETTLNNLQTFVSVEQLNESIKVHKQTHELSETDRNILDAISRYSCKYKGVCYLSKQKIAEEAGYKSRRTAIRACKRMESLGILGQHETKRVKGDRRQSVNVIVIKEVAACKDVQDEKEQRQGSEVTAESHGLETSLQATNSSNTYKDTGMHEEQKPSVSYVIKRGIKNAIPHEIYNGLSPFFNGQDLYKTYGILLRAKAKVDRNIMLEDYADDYINAFYNVVRLDKEKKIRKSFEGMLYATWERLTAQLSRQVKARDNASNNEQGQRDTSVYFDWTKGEEVEAL